MQIETEAFSFLPDKQSEFLQFILGNLDFMKGLDASYKDDLITGKGTLRPKYRKTIQMETGPYLNTEYLGVYLDSENSILNNKLIRKAINCGFDRFKMIQYLRNGIGIPAANGFIPKGLPSFNNQKGHEYDPEKARNLVKQFVQETDIDNPSISISTNSNYLDVCEFMQEELRKVGLEVSVDVVPPSILRQGKVMGKFTIFRASWIADYPDAENYLSLFYSENFAPYGSNYTHFTNAMFDRLYQQSSREVRTSKRHRMYQKMDSILIAESAVIVLYYDQVVRLSHKNVQGLVMNPIDLLELKRVKKLSS